jgi:hypothetical protein
MYTNDRQDKKYPHSDNDDLCSLSVTMTSGKVAHGTPSFHGRHLFLQTPLKKKSSGTDPNYNINQTIFIFELPL